MADPATMIKMGAPHLIHSEKELHAYSEQLFALTSKKRLTSNEEKAVELLTLLIEQYEKEHFELPDADPVEVLRYLMQSHGLSQRDLIPEFGAESTVSLVLNGKRNLNLNHIEKLSKRFSVSPAVFF
jgi:HTH-type transcriptional regulator/antitoxin HigA